MGWFAEGTSHRTFGIFTGLLLAAVSCLGQAGDSAAVRAYTNQHRKEIAEEYLKLLAVNNLHGNVEGLQKNADLLVSMMKKRGLNTELWPTSTGVPVVFGQKLVPGAKRTLLFYIHFDGQPVAPKRWKQDDPWTPVVRTDSIEAGGQLVTDLSQADYPDAWRIYARSAGDDKVPIEAILCALDALRSAPKENVKIILHGEEEGGSPKGDGLGEVIAKYPEKLKSDLLIMLDGPEHPSGRPTMYYGGRGGAGLEVTVYTAKQGMHSGNYGNWQPDANVRLSQLISSMVDATGKVIIPGFYSDVLPFAPTAKTMMAAVPDDSKQMQKDFGVGSLDGAASSLQEGLNMPTFGVRIVQSGEVGGVIPPYATATISMRLVKDNDPGMMYQRVVDFVRAQGYFIVDKDPDVATLASHAKVAKIPARRTSGPMGSKGSGAWRTEPTDPQAEFVTAALRKVWGDKLVRIRTLGGGVPATPFIDAYHVPTVGIAIANYDDNQHSDNENIRMGNLFDGVVTLAGLMTQ
jgi:acetylornithine deacetylase/succinyl-diaminopimelate desuccinylase-like protein